MAGAAKWLLVAAVFIAAKWPTLHDPMYWDAFAYAEQIRFLLHHAFHLGDYTALPFLRPPVYTASVAAAMAVAGEGVAVAHVVTWLWALVGLAGVHALTCELGGREPARWLAVAMLALSPTFFAQSGLVLSDIPVATLLTFAWLALLRGSRWQFVVLNSLAVLCKEQAYVLCVPAFAYLVALNRDRGWLRALLAAAPALLPGVIILPWTFVAYRLTGTALFRGSTDALGPRWLFTALEHNFIRGGRVGLWLVAGAGLWLERGEASEIPRRRRFSFLAAACLPVLFPAAVTRYMLPAAPLLCALGAVTLQRVGAWARGLGAVAIVASFLLGWQVAPTRRGDGDLDWNMGYRRVLDVQRQAVGAVERAGDVRVLATFPIYSALTQPEGGFVDRPISATPVQEGMGIAALCAHSLLIDAAQGVPTSPALEPLVAMGRAHLWQSFGPPDLRIDIYRIECGR